MNNIFKTIAAALIDLDLNKQNVINEDNKLPAEFIDGTVASEHLHYIKYELIGVESSSDVAEVNHGESYTTQLSASEEVKILVGGIDLTDQYYNSTTGVITIDYVSGNIDIYATNVSKVELFYINKYITGSVYMSNRDTQVVAGSTYESTMIVNEGYQLDRIQVMMGSIDITGTAWDSVNQTITIPEVTNNVFISIDTSLMGFRVIYNLINCTSSITVEKVVYGNPFSCTILPIPGYNLSQCYYSMGGIEYQASNGNIVIDSVTGELIITAAAEAVMYSITYNLTNSTISNRIIEALHGTNIVLHYLVDPGYDPESPGVSVLGAEFSVNTDGRTIMINNITQDVIVTMVPNIRVYKINYLLSNCTASSISDRTRYYGESFTTVITPSDGFIIEDVTITMDDEDITSSAYNEITKTVSISAITGDVSIIASGIINTVQVFNMLSNVRTDNANTIIDRHSSYEANLTYDTTRFKDVDIQVTMDGIDITEDVVNGHSITILDATGNIAVIASAISFDYYNFTYNLNGAQLDYMPAQLREDQEYLGHFSTTILNPYWEVRLIMNEEDVTDTYVDLTTNTINITDLTGNVNIVLIANRTINPLTLSDLTSMEIDDQKTVLIGNPQRSHGYFVGFNPSEGAQGYGNGFSTERHINAVANTLSSNPTYKFIITKHQDTENGEYYVDVPKTFTVSGRFNNANLSSASFPIDGYDLYQVNNVNLPLTTRTGTITISFDGTPPQTIYVKLYSSNANATIIAQVGSGGSGAIVASDDNNTVSMEGFYPVQMTSATMTLITTVSRSGLFDRGSIHILVPNNIVETEVNREVILVGDPYYTIKSSNGAYTPSINGWTNSQVSYNFISPSINSDAPIASGINTDTLISVIDENGKYLDAGSNINGLILSDSIDESSVWQIYEV